MCKVWNIVVVWIDEFNIRRITVSKIILLRAKSRDPLGLKTTDDASDLVTHHNQKDHELICMNLFDLLHPRHCSVLSCVSVMFVDYLMLQHKLLKCNPVPMLNILQDLNHLMKNFA